MSDKATFVHDIAIDISRALNLTNPNDLLAKNVIRLGTTHKDFNKFTQGKTIKTQSIMGWWWWWFIHLYK
jgi:hypothetical protein